MKRLATTLVVTALAVASCGGSDDAGGSEGAGSVASVAPTAAVVDSAPPATEASTDTTATTATTSTATTDQSAGSPSNSRSRSSTRYGSTTLEEPPQRIVSLDTQWTDVLVALEAPLAAAALDPYTDDGTYPWQTDMPADVERIPVEDGSIPYEAIAALDPDLIVITYYATSEADYDLLSDIAPTIPLLGDEEVDASQDIAAVAGQIIGDPGAAATLVADVDALTPTCEPNFPDSEGTTYAFANYVPGDSIYVVADPDDGAGILFGQLGMEIDPDSLAIAQRHLRPSTAQPGTDRPTRCRRAHHVDERHRPLGHPRLRRTARRAIRCGRHSRRPGHHGAEHADAIVDPVLAREDPRRPGGQRRVLRRPRRASAGVSGRRPQDGEQGVIHRRPVGELRVEPLERR